MNAPIDDRTPSSTTANSVIGRFTKRRYTAAWSDASRCWTYYDERQYGPSLGSAENRHATPEKALEAASAQDVYDAAQGGPLARSEYEAEVSRLELHVSWVDRDCAAMVRGDWDFLTYGIEGAAQRTLAARRGLAVLAEAKAAEPVLDEGRLERELQIADLESQAQDAEDRDQLARASALRAKARALRTGAETDLPRVYINSRADLETHLANLRGDVLAEGWLESLVAAVQAADHPPYGDDWSQWLEDKLNAIVNRFVPATHL